MIGKKKKDAHNYTSLGEEITIDDVLSQASTLLDLAAHKALDRGNPLEISSVAESFMGLAGVVTNIQMAMSSASKEAAEAQKETDKKDFKTGFSGPDSNDEDKVTVE